MIRRCWQHCIILVMTMKTGVQHATPNATNEKYASGSSILNLVLHPSERVCSGYVHVAEETL